MGNKRYHAYLMIMFIVEFTHSNVRFMGGEFMSFIANNDRVILFHQTGDEF